MTEVARALVDNEGRLTSADPALAGLNARAGGDLGAVIAVPALAGVARLARRLGVIVSRPVTVADGDADIDLWVRAQPSSDGVRLAISGWRTQQAMAGDATTVTDDAGWRWETDAALRLTFVAVEAAKARGIVVADLLGQPITTLVVLEPDAAGGLPLIDALAGRVDLAGQRVRLRGDRRSAVLDARVRRDAAGAFAGFSGTVTLIEEASPSGAALTASFTAGLDRALRRPLARIVANADSIHAAADGTIGDDYVDYAADIAGAGRHLMTLIDDLVDLQAIERADFAVAAEPIDLADLARRAAGLLSVRADDALITIERPDPSATLPAVGEFRRVLQILVNLIGNAVRYAPRGSAVSVSVERVDATASVTVADRGRGIAQEDQARVFEKFERVDAGESGGSGLGLYIARRLARAMGGDLTLASGSGEGARFTLSLPTG